MYLTDDPQQESFAAPLSGLAMVNACALLLILLGTVFFNPLGRRAEAYASNLFAPSARSVTEGGAVKGATLSLSDPGPGTGRLANSEPGAGTGRLASFEIGSNAGHSDACCSEGRLAMQHSGGGVAK
jgi:hypothetical protein